MNDRQRRFWASSLSLLLLVTLVVSMVAPYGANVFAQESTAEPPTPLPTEPTTEPVMPPPPEVTPEPVVPTVAPPVAPTEPVAPVLPTQPINPDVWGDDFEDGDTNGWTLSTGWSVVAEGGEVPNNVLRTNGQFETAVVNGLLWEHLNIQARIGVQPGNTANIAFRVAADNYNVTLRSDGSVRLFQGMTPLVDGPAVPPAPETPVSGPQWYSVEVMALGSEITVSVNSVPQIAYIAANPLPAGTVIFSSGLNNTGTVALDDVFVQRLAAPPVIVTPPPTVEPTVVVPTIEVTPEPVMPTVEPTVEPTGEPVEPGPELTPEPTVEPTIEPTEPGPELTPEPTVEPTIEPTEPGPELTPEPTVEPTIEPTPEPTPDPDGEPVLSNDFEGDTSAWAFTDGASVLTGEANSAAYLPAGSGFAPAQAMTLAGLRADFRVNLLDAATAPQSDAGAIEATPEVTPAAVEGLRFRFRVDEERAYVLLLNLTETALYRVVAGETTLLASVPAARTSATWYAVSLRAENGVLRVDVDGVTELLFEDEAPLLAGGFGFAGGDAGAVLVDDVAVFDLSGGEVMPTVAPFALDDAVRARLGGALARLIEAHMNDNPDAVAQITADYFLPTDDAGRYVVMVTPADGASIDALAALVAQGGGEVADNDNGTLRAYVPLSFLLELASSDNVQAIILPERVISTGANLSPAQAVTSGSVAPHTLDILGVNSWHESGARGANIDIAVVDTGFSGVNNGSAERACYAAGALGTGSHGTNVVEVLCDIAPDAEVYTYPVANTQDIADKIIQATNGGRDIVLVTVDTGITNNGGDIVAAIDYAYGRGVPVIASAGNTGQSGGVAFTYGGPQANVTINTSAGSLISYGWDAGDDVSYPSTLYSGETAIDSSPANIAGSAYQYTVPASCGEACTLRLNIQGEGVTTMEVQASGSNIALDGGLVGVAASTLTTAAEAENAIAVGAVCLDPQSTPDGDRWSIWEDSSRGDTGAGTPAVKPEVVAPMGVSTSLLTSDGMCDTGFNGTSSSATHVAGMAALLFSNPNSSMSLYFLSDRPDRLEHYLMTRTVDLYPNRDTSGTPDGYDNTYGSGLVQLGNPNFDLTFNWYRTWDLPDNAPGDAIYVGTAAIRDGNNNYITPNGTINAPYNHPARAIQAARSTTSKTVVFLPGEYVSGFRVFNDVSIVSYDSQDQIDYPNSSIWVTEMFEGGGGILITGATSGARVEGFDFTGAERLYEDYPGMSPDYVEHTLNRLRPLVVESSGASGTANRVTIADNTFVNFDYPVQVLDSNNVWITDNLFRDFDIASVSFGQQTLPDHPTAALEINNSGRGTGNRLQILRNSFEGNSIARGSSSSNVYQGIVSITYSGVDFFGSRFIDNTAPAVININQWQGGVTGSTATGEEVVIFSSVFDGNDVSNGTLIHLYQGRNFRFTNNTVANHYIRGAMGNIITVGDRTSTAEHILNGTNKHRADVFNNLLYNNDINGGLIGRPAQTDVVFTFVECRRVGSDTNQTAVDNNWFAPRGNMGAGMCEEGTITGNNIITDTWQGTQLVPTSGNPTEAQIAASAAARADFEETFFFTPANDAADPYRLRPTSQLGEADPNLGIDTGDDSLALRILNSLDPQSDERAYDAQGGFRAVSLTPGTVGQLINIDIGAYETGQPDPIRQVNNPPSVSTTEDNRVTFSLDARVEDGFQPYVFTITQQPTYYDTDADSACGTAGILINGDGTATYCPPDDFFTYGENTVTFTYTARGALLPETVTETVTINVSSSDDGSPSAYTSDPDDSNDVETVFVDSLSDVDYRLRPYVDFGGPDLGFSDPGIDVDYGWTFSNFQTVELSGEAFTSGQVSTAFSNATTTGRVQLTPQPGEEGVLEFTYNVRDGINPGGGQRSGESQSTSNARRVRIVVVRQLANEGVYDDTSLYMRYNTGWTPLYFAPVYNSTLHYSQGNSRSFEMSFVGNAFLIDFRRYSPGGTFRVELGEEPANENDPIVYQNVLGGSIPGITCYTDNTTSGNLVSMTHTTADDAYFGCGLDESADSNILRHLRVTTVSGDLYVDALLVRDTGALRTSEGLVDEDEFGLGYTGNWDTWNNPSTLGGTARYTNDPNATLTFNVEMDGAADVVIYHYTNPAQGVMRVCRDVNTNCQTLNLNSSATTYRNAWVLPASVLGLPTTGQATITVYRSSGYINVSGVQVRPTVRLGNLYQQDAPQITQDGDSWFTWDRAQNLGGSAMYNNNTSQPLRFTLDTTGAENLVIYHYRNPAQGIARVCLNETNNCQTRNFNSSTTTYGNPWVIPLSNLGIVTGQTARVSMWVQSGYINLDAVQLISATQALEAGGIYQENALGVSQTGGGWPVWGNSLTLGGTAIYSNNGTLELTLDTTDANELVIYHYTNSAQGTAQVCNGPTCVTKSFNNATQTYRNAWVIPFSDLNLTPDTVQTVTMQPTSGYINLSGVQVRPTPITLAGGFYDEDEPQITQNGEWFTWVQTNNLLGGTALYSNETDSSLTFSIDTTGADYLVLHHYRNSAQGNVEVCRNTSDSCQTFSFKNSATIFQDETVIPFSALGLSAAAVETITLRPVDAYVNLSGVSLWDALPTLTLNGGFYDQSSSELAYLGNWLIWNETNNRGGDAVYANSVNASVTFTIDATGVSDVVLYNYTNSAQGSAEICHDGNCVTRSFNSAAQTFKQATVVTALELGLPTSGTAEITVTRQSGYINLDGVALRSALAADTTTSAPDSANITQLGEWFTWNDTRLPGGAALYSNATDAGLSFTLDTTNVSYVVLHHYEHPLHGPVEVCYNATCAVRDFYAASVDYQAQWAIPVGDLGLPGSGLARLTVRPQTPGDYLNVAAVELRSGLPALNAGQLYEEDAFEIAYNGNWETWNNASTQGGTAVYANSSGATVTFQVDTTNMDSLVIYHYTNSAQGTAEICRNTSDNCQSRSFNSTSTTYLNQWVLSKAALGLSDDTVETITIRRVSGYINVSAVGVRAVQRPEMQPNSFHQEESFAIDYNAIGTWQTSYSSNFNGGHVRFNQTPGAYVEFDLATGSSGFIAYMNRFNTGAALRVCYKPKSSGSEVCSVVQETIDLFNSTTQYTYGFPFVGLPTNQAYTVRIEHIGTSSEFISLDGIAVLGTPSETLSASDGRVDDTDPALLYSPGAGIWQEFAWSSYYGGSQSYVLNAGAVVHFRMTGNAFTLVQRISRFSSREVMMCVVAENTIETSRVDCATFGQYSGGDTPQVPISFYGLGSGVHDVYIINLSAGGILSIDAIEPQ